MISIEGRSEYDKQLAMIDNRMEWIPILVQKVTDTDGVVKLGVLQRALTIIDQTEKKHSSHSLTCDVFPLQRTTLPKASIPVEVHPSEKQIPLGNISTPAEAFDLLSLTLETMSGEHPDSRHPNDEFGFRAARNRVVGWVGRIRDAATQDRLFHIGYEKVPASIQFSSELPMRVVTDLTHRLRALPQLATFQGTPTSEDGKPQPLILEISRSGVYLVITSNPDQTYAVSAQVEAGHIPQIAAALSN